MSLRFHEQFRIRNGALASQPGGDGAFMFRLPNGSVVAVIASSGEGWEHVSVSLENRVPTWDEMCSVKRLFWDAEDCVVQFHPPKSEYVNCHPHCLHLWRSLDAEMPRPPATLRSARAAHYRLAVAAAVDSDLEINMTREELLSKSTFFDCNDSETLSHRTIEDAVEYYIDGFLTPQMTPEEVEAEIRRLSPISVDCYARSEWTAIKRAWYTEAVKDNLFDLFDEDEEFSNPDCTVNETMTAENRRKIVAKADELVSAFTEIAVPWGFNCIGTILLSADDTVAMMRKENPEWFENGDSK